MQALLPPSSSVTRLTVPAALRAISTPTSVEPVNPTFRRADARRARRPRRGPARDDVERARGQPGLEPELGVAQHGEGERLAGFSTTVLPAASAGAVFQLPMLSGKFQGVMSAVTPIGSRKVRTMPSRSTGIVEPKNLSIAPA